MKKYVRGRVFEIIGAVGTIACVIIFALQPSFPTPDKLLVFMTFVAMIFGRTKSLLKRFVPFVVLLLVYESFRGLVPHLNSHVNYSWMPWADRTLFLGQLPTHVLQNWWWHGHVQWYDFVFYGAYTLHFVLPFALAALIWIKIDKEYWHFASTILLTSFMAFLTFLAFPAAPPWMAAENHQLAEPITRVSSAVWAAFGIHDFPSVYNKISPNPVAAVPSLHAAYSFLTAFFITRLFKPKWRYFAWIYPLLIWVGTVYQGEHYAIDAILGVMYALVAFYASPYLLRALHKGYAHVKLSSR